MTIDRVTVAGAGICCLDYIITAPRVEWGGAGRVVDFFIQGGGLVGTAMVACARLGARCELFSMLGDDAVADEVTAEFAREGIETGRIARIRGGRSPLSFVHVDAASGERTIFHRPGENLTWDPRADLSAIAHCGAILIDDCYPDMSATCALFAREHSVPVIGDMIPRPENAELLRLVDILIAPRHFVAGTPHPDDPVAALDHILRLGPATALITLGADGLVYADASGRGRLDAFKVDVVDTTGAGDTFHGAYAYGVARGWETARCAQFASAVAAIKCTRPGGRTGLPSLDQTIEFLRSRGTLDW